MDLQFRLNQRVKLSTLHAIQRRVLLGALLIAGAAAQAQSTNFYLFSTIAGIPNGMGDADGVGSAARYANPMGIAVDRSGNIYVADTGNNSIRELFISGTNWQSAMIAGGSFGTADGTNSSIQFASPQGLALDPAGNIYVADTGNATIRKLTPSGTNWVSTTLAGGTNGALQLYSPVGLAVDAQNNIYVADDGGGAIYKLTLSDTNWVPSTVTWGFYYNPTGIAVDASGNLYVADEENAGIQLFTPQGTNWGSNAIATDIGNIYAVSVDASNNLFVTQASEDTILELIPQPPKAPSAAACKSAVPNTRSAADLSIQMVPLSPRPRAAKVRSRCICKRI